MTTLEDRPTVDAPPPPPRSNPVLALLRNSWRQLTSMRTALVLLFLLAVAAVPGSVLPQRSVNREDVARYFAEHPDLAPVLDRFGGFDVYAAPWFAAIYLLLFASLIGCVVPRLRDHVRALRAVPPEAPKRLDRLPQHAGAEPHTGDPAGTAEAIRRLLRARRFRTRVRPQPDGGYTVSAEKGYAKETGNLLFHFALLAVLIGVGFGSWYGWHGNRLLVAGPEHGFCNVLEQYDEAGLGPRVDTADLPRFCLELTEFEATYQPDGQPRSFDARVAVEQPGGVRQARNFSVNSPLRLDDASVYLLGHGYAPMIRYTDRYGQAQTVVAPFLPTDGMLTSEGVALFPDTNVDPQTGERDPALQMGFEGLYLPTVPESGMMVRSAFPAERDPGVLLWAYRGNLGLDAGIPRSVYELNRAQVERGVLAQVGEPTLLRLGETWTLDDGSTVEFVGTQRWITISVRHDPAQRLVLVGAVLGLAGLMLSLTGRRRRVWFRIAPAEPSPTARSSVAAGGLPRTEYPGFADEFAQLVAAARDVGARDAATGADGGHADDRRAEGTP